MRLFALLLALLAYICSINADVSVYIDSGADSTVTPDGSQEKPYFDFTTAYSKNISTSMTSDNVTVIFMFSETPYNFTLNYVAQVQDDYPYNLTFQSNITDPIIDLYNCTVYPSLVFVAPTPSTGLSKLQDAPGEALIFKTNNLNMAFQNLNISVLYGSSDDNPLASLGLIQASSYLNLTMNNICIDFNNASILNTTTDSIFAFSSGAQMNASFTNISINATVNIQGPPVPSNDSSLSEATTKMFSLFQISATPNVSLEHIGQLNITNITLTQAINCTICDNTTTILELSTFTLTNTPNLTISNSSIYNLTSNITTYLIYFSETQKAAPSSEEAPITQSVIYLYNTSICNATNTTFIYSKSGSLNLDFNVTNVTNVTISKTPFIEIDASDLDASFAVNFTDFNLTISNVTNTSLFDFEITVGKTIHSVILITDLQVTGGFMTNDDTVKTPFFQSNYPINVDSSLFSDNIWQGATVFKGTDNPSSIFNVSNTTFANEQYNASVLFSQAHVSATSLKPSVVFLCTFNTLTFQTASSFISNQGFQFIFDTNTLDTITISDGKFSDNIGVVGKKLSHVAEYEYQPSKDVPDDCKKNCYYLQVSGSSFTKVQLSTEKTSLFSAVKPSGVTKGYVAIDSNTFSQITVSYPFLYVANIDSVDVSQNTGLEISIPNTLFNITGAIKSLKIDGNSFAGTQAQDFLYFTVLEYGPTPDVVITSNTLSSHSVYSRSFMTVITPNVNTLTFSSNSIKDTELICSPSIIQAKGVSIVTSPVDGSTFEFKSNSFETTSVSIQGDRSGYLPDFANTMFELQISSSSTISIEGLSFSGCTMDAVFSSLARIGVDQLTLDSLNIQNTNVTNLDFSGAVNIVANSFTITNSQFAANSLESNITRYGFDAPAVKLENPIAQPDNAITVTITGVTFGDGQDTSIIQGYFYVNLPNINLNIDQVTLQNYGGRYFYVNSETVAVTVGDITYQAVSGSTILYMGQGSGTVQVQKYQDSAPADDAVLAPAFYFESCQNLALTFSGLKTQGSQLIYANLNNSQLSVTDLTVSQSKSSQDFITVSGDTLAVSLETLYLTGNNAPSSVFLNMGSPQAKSISIAASSMLAQGSKFATLFDLSLAPATILSISNSVFDKNVFTVADYGETTTTAATSPSNGNTFFLNSSILTNHLGTVLKTANSGTFTMGGVIISGSNTQETLSQSASLFALGLSEAHNPTPPKFLVNDSTIQNMYHPKLSGVINGLQTTTVIGAANLVNNSFFNASSSNLVYGTMLDQSSITIENTSYFLNAATYSSSCLTITNSAYSVANSNFLYNIGNTGGAVYLSNSHTFDNKTIQSSNNFTNNVAIAAGGDVTSSVNSISVTFTNQCDEYNSTTFAKYLNDDFVLINNNVYNLVNFSLFAWNCKVLTLSFLDFYGKPVPISPNQTIITSTTPSVNPTPIYQCFSTYCNLIASSLQIPGTTNTFALNFTIAQPPNQQSQNSLIFNFIPRECMVGEYTVPTDNKCRLCPVNTYSGDNSSACQPCSITYIQGYCLGGDMMSINKYNWREPNSSVVYQCPDDSIDRCEGGLNPVNQCSEGYAGAMCLHCDPSEGYAPDMTNTGCSKCNSSTGLEVLLAILLFVVGFLFEIFYIVVINASNKASLELDNLRTAQTYKGEKYVLGAYLGFAVSNLQILFILLDYMKFLFPNYSSRFQMLAGPLGFIASPSTFGRNALECVLADSQESAMVIFKYKVYVESFLPVAKMIFIAVGVMLLFATDKIRGVKNLIIVSIFSMLMLEQTPTFLNMIKSLSCFLGSVSPPGYVRNDLRISCGDPDYLSFKQYFIIPTAIFWSGFLLLIYVGGLLFAKKKLPGQKVKRLFGDLVNNYMDYNFYWGLVILVLKFLLILALIMIPEPVEAIIPGVILFFAYYMGIQYLTPYQSKDLQRFDKLVTLGFIGMMALATFTNNAQNGSVTKTLGSFAIFIVALALLMYILIRLVERLFKYWKAWRQYRSTNPLGSALFTVEDPLEALNP